MADRTQVLLVGPLGAPPLLGGIENGVQMLVESRLAHELSMRLFNTARDEDRERPLHQKIAYQITACARFAATVVWLRPRVVHVKTSSGVNFYQNAMFVLIARLLGRRVVLQLHSGGFPSFFERAGWARRWVIRAALKLPHSLIALSSGWARYFKELAGRQSVTVVGNALHTADYRGATPDRAGLGIPGDRVALLFMSTRTRSLDVDKGLLELIGATAVVRRRRPELMLVIAGPISHAAELESALGPAGAGWLSLGIVPPERKPVVYRSADLFALPSHYENMPNTLLEAMATGLPVIATPVGAIPEMIDDGETGLLVPLRDVEALAERIDRLLADRGLRERMGARAAGFAAKEFDFSLFEQRLLDAYTSVGGARGSRAAATAACVEGARTGEDVEPPRRQ